ncbi:MAG: 3-ketoacyl-ACP reductase [Alphaproteobacteria bacterium]|nr:3-ketoacyl-ACP reductase [Alphaproteobacteria bacterium]
MSGQRPLALVTGARRGLGRAIALALAGRGFDLALNDLADSDDLRETARQVNEAGAATIVLPADIADLDGHQPLIDQAASFGALTCLVNNAGVSVLARGDLLEASVESFDRCLEINTRATFFLTQAFAKHLLNPLHKGPVKAGSPATIVVVSSANATAVSVNRGEYCVSKAAASMVAKLFAVRLAGEGIGVYEIRPGIIATEMTAPSKARYDAFFADGRCPMPRWGEPAEVGRAVAACAAGDLPYTVGQPILIDGGLTLPNF